LAEGKLDFYPILKDCPNRWLIASFARGDAVEPIKSPIEPLQLWPLKASVGNVVISTICEEKISRCSEPIGATHD
jgi:hypothetical protein